MELRYSYNNHEIAFEKDDQILVNATQMGKAFGKEPRSFLRLESTKNFIQALEISQEFRTDVYGKEPYKCIVTTATKGGTFMHRTLALKFAAWLDPKFEVWVFSTIEQLMFGGQFTAVSNWYQETSAISQSTIEIKKRIAKIKREISTFPIVIERKSAVAAVKNIKRSVALKQAEIMAELDLFAVTDNSALKGLAQENKALRETLCKKAAELAAIETEYNNLPEIIEMTELSTERIQGLARKKLLTKELYTNKGNANLEV